jgi:hypothetical protein
MFVMRAAAPLLLLCLLLACTPLRPPDPGPAPAGPDEGVPGEGPLLLLEPHWDQVCGDDRAAPVFQNLAEILEVQGLAEALHPLLPPFVSGEPPPRVDVAVTWARTGEIRTVHLAGFDGGRDGAESVLRRVAERVRRQNQLVEPVFLRVRAMRGPSSSVLRILPPERCLPHIRHEPDQPPRFLEGASVTSGTARLLRGPLGSPPNLSVRIHLSRTGAVLGMDPVDGDAALLPRVQAALAETVFDPALLNREPVASSLELRFGFRE